MKYNKNYTNNNVQQPISSLEYFKFILSFWECSFSRRHSVLSSPELCKADRFIK